MIQSIINEIKEEFNHQIDNFNLDQIENFVSLIRDSRSNIHVCGVGKSNNIAKHFCDLLKCISIKAFHFSVIDSTHGDSGALSKEDILICFSASGSSQEILNIIESCHSHGVYIVGVVCKKESKFSKVCDLIIELPLGGELSGEVNQIPSNSYMSNLLFSNIVTAMLKCNLTIEQYKLNHPAGTIGSDLLTVKDVLLTEGFPVIELKNEIYIDIHQPLLEMTKYKFGCCCFVDEDKKLIGILTDGDIRRMFLNNKFKLLHEELNSNFYSETDLNRSLSDIKKLSIKYIPFTSSGKLIGILDI